MEKRKADSPGTAPMRAAGGANTPNEPSREKDAKAVDENFYKIFMKEFRPGLGEIKSRQLKLVLWLMEHMSLKNELRYTYAEMAKAAGVSLQTVATTIQSLEKNGFLRRKGSRLVISPYAVFKGSYANRCRVMKTYSEPGEPEDGRDDHRKNKKKEILLKPETKTEDENFFKLFMKDFEKGLRGIDSRQVRLILWLIKHMSRKNELPYTYREIGDASKISLHTVAVTINSLEKGGFLRRNRKGMMINPEAVFKGRRHEREDALYAYASMGTLTEKELEQKRKELEDAREQIAALTAKKKELTDRLSGELAELERLEENIGLYAGDAKRLAERIALAEKANLRAEKREREAAQKKESRSGNADAAPEPDTGKPACGTEP